MDISMDLSGMRLVSVSNGIESLIELCGERLPLREGMKDTPKRFLKGMAELTQGYKIDPDKLLNKNFPVDDVEGVNFYDEMIVSGGIPFVSVCEHHLFPFFGQAYIAYIPNPETKRIVGLSKLARCFLAYAQRFQVQERLTRQTVDSIDKALQPLGAAVIIKSKHTCQCFRGIKADGWMITSAMTGVFRDSTNSARNELLQLIGPL